VTQDIVSIWDGVCRIKETTTVTYMGSPYSDNVIETECDEHGNFTHYSIWGTDETGASFAYSIEATLAYDGDLLVGVENSYVMDGSVVLIDNQILEYDADGQLTFLSLIFDPETSAYSAEVYVDYSLAIAYDEDGHRVSHEKDQGIDGVVDVAYTWTWVDGSTATETYSDADGVNYSLTFDRDGTEYARIETQWEDSGSDGVDEYRGDYSYTVDTWPWSWSLDYMDTSAEEETLLFTRNGTYTCD